MQRIVQQRPEHPHSRVSKGQYFVMMTLTLLIKLFPLFHRRAK